MWKRLLILALVITACSSDDGVEKVNQNTKSDESIVISDSVEISNSVNDLDTTTTVKNSTSTYSYKVVYDENTGWGYQIYDGSNMVINQMHIPAVQGIQGFDSRNKAETTADYVIKQIEKGNFPPTLSKEILDSLDVL